VALAVELAVGLALIVGFRVAGATPARMFFVLATIGVLNLLVMYAVTDVAAARHLHRRGARPVTAVLPLVGAVVAVAVLVNTAASAPPALVLVLAAWLAVAVVFAPVRGRR
jgi:hypothetical protein